MAKQGFREGFTLIELSLSIIFISILSLTIVLIINNTIKAYQRGLILSQVNTTGMDLVDDMRSAVQNSSTKSIVDDCTTIYTSQSVKDVCEQDGAYNFVTVRRDGTVYLNGEKMENVPLYGAFCSGTYSYIWNSGYFWAEGADMQTVTPATLKYKDSTGTTKEYTQFRLLKVRDDSRGVCVSAVGAEYNISRLPNGRINNSFDITGYANVPENPVDLILADGENTDLAIYDLSVPMPAESIANNNTFYTVSFILGTIKGGINIRANGKNCSAPNDFSTENFSYCAINKFNFAAQASGE